MTDVEQALEGSVVTGVHCSSCDFLVEAVFGKVTNSDILNATGLHHSKFHGPESGTTRPCYDIRATRRAVVNAVDIKVVI